ncbi:K+-transporting ATPase ATPase B chain [Thermosporothrix hazakensis]|jgi:K+-transporting ATPase ATPase B chain|uniref:Potassium-transporting ATPase ATP-binding subunit n=2 Tax=Thermosporothrix TaxID=768650 RepID=A0A326UNX5_THEHA|nr:potassium-transporting ATPase subunit KdpB [Thermosporothrix hazakensis]PZW31962.1 K+-transporting ATPase ATPase B chain [Thermosporothrix hazakensis]BBH91567.1 potassium-transporting ATPase ATP-binding subunit [Thermosporothrix sp. COM3]GCE49713.1 potassium-transporting ATPase ATP-binding subunit [Thermosporothrix hazakensis]
MSIGTLESKEWKSQKKNNASSIFNGAILRRAMLDALKKLDPRWQMKNPVMFVVEIGSVITTIEAVRLIITGPAAEMWFVLGVTLWLWFTVLFANFAEAMAEGRGKAQADALRKTRTTTMAKRLASASRDSSYEEISAPQLRKGDVVLVEAGDVIPGDGEVIEGVASVDESAITGESAPVIRESGGDRSAVTGGTRVLSDWIVVKISANPGETFLDRMISLVEGAARQKTPNEIALNILLASLTIIFLLAVVTLEPFAIYSGNAVSITTLIALLVCLIPTTIGGLLSAIGIAGMDRMVQRNVLAMSGRAVEAAGDVDVLLLDKTGTITLGNRMASRFVPAQGVHERELAQAALLSSLADETPEGRSIVKLAEDRYGLHATEETGATFIPFTAQTRMSGVDLNEGGGVRMIRKGASDAVNTYVIENGGQRSKELDALVKEIASSGSTPLVVAEMVTQGAGKGQARLLGVIELKDIVKGGMRERFEQLRRMGIRTIMITGDNPLTAAAIAKEAGVDDFLAQATPETKMKLIKEQQAGGRLVAMTGDGTNDAPALAQADVGLAMNTGTQAAKEAANMVDLDSNPTKLIEVVEVGKQLLMTRGALTTFSIANDVAKYFAIIPAMFSATYPQLNALNIMHLATPHSAVLSAVIFNAIIIIILIPLALRGVKYRALGAGTLLRRNLLLYGLGGLIVPFIGIKLIDLVLVLLHLA